MEISPCPKQTSKKPFNDFLATDVYGDTKILPKYNQHKFAIMT